ncbi:F-box protein At5g07610-like [Papaver somniferum]|uniref:F-box protein At5g07610-like n=1 Tax=Papaver somniferum TaxID=3469 RepID=UPI000E6F5627|nr:F-box protein At5g07610-like [Papaver somniferum]
MASSKQRRRGGGRRRCSRKGKILNDSNSSSSLPSSAASFIGSDIDILTLILTRFPSKSLVMFKCVSKQWLSWINDPKFVHQHFIQNPRLSIAGLFWVCELSSTTKPTYGCIFLDGNTDSHIPFKTLDFKIGNFVREGIKIVQSCNGLLLCSNRARYSSNRTYYIFNPFTKQYKVLPQSEMGSLQFPYLRNVSLTFDPLKSPYYKVIYFWRNRDLDYRIEIYNSETSSWRLSELDSRNLPADAILWTPSIFWNGSLYWCDRKGVISYFDVDHELVGVVPLPTPVNTNRDTMTFYIAEFRDHFYLIEKKIQAVSAYSTWILPTAGR